MHFLNTPGILEPKYLDTLKSQGHSITMILVNTASRIRAAINDPLLTEQIDRSIKALRTYFMHPEFKALLEMVGPDGEFIDSINGRTINPGHCIETAWFILEEAKYRNWDKELVDMALTILDWSWDWGWDKEYGGIINFRDCKNLPPQDYSQDMKFWWPQTEAIIATLYAYQPRAMKNIWRCISKSATGPMPISLIKNMVNGMAICIVTEQWHSRLRVISSRDRSIFPE